ncbi:MAG TPA: methylated-DNA--[protein]-cysteine S-methyltransferase [Candidatus Binataceae bacterium]|jgi:O-6-methylguanine DNA methyltransferase|nr:methylated-DNA--[protein]-cysteine S-methyltransferase [Candidatus Binataceae bacterium]
MDDALQRENALIDSVLPLAQRRIAAALRRIRRPTATIAVAATRLGRLLVAASDRGLLTVRYADDEDDTSFIADLRRLFDLAENPTLAADVSREIDALLNGCPEPITARPVDLSLVTSAFERRALARLRAVPPGAVTTYRALAAAAGSPDAQRAIGNTVAANPLAIYVPCHRVIKSDGAIGNYGGGVQRKVALLRAEGFVADGAGRVPATAVYGHLGTRIFCRLTCGAARRARRERMLIFAEPARAAAAGLRPCKLCRPG